MDAPNVRSLLFEEHEGAYIVGAIAAMTSKTGKVGFVGGMDVPLIRRFEMGYEAGAKKINPQITVTANYCGVTSEAWNNPPKGKELALAQYDGGADVIFAAAGASGFGVFDAAEERKKLAIGCRFQSGLDQTRPDSDEHAQAGGPGRLHHHRRKPKPASSPPASNVSAWPTKASITPSISTTRRSCPNPCASAPTN